MRIGGTLHVERVVFSVGQEGAQEGYERAFELGMWGAHFLLYGDHLVATGFTSNTPDDELLHGEQELLEQAVINEGRKRFVDELQARYVTRITASVGQDLLKMARHVLRESQASAVPALIFEDQ